MLARLWWKEFRALGPSWPLLWLAAAGVQGLLLYSGDDEARQGMLTPIALIWAVLYGFAAGSAAFAGERESRSLAFLDALPVGRGVLWLGKASFALASTFGLALALAGLAALGTESRGTTAFGNDRAVREFGILLFEAVAWSMLWSAMLGNPLAAGALGVSSVGLILSIANAVFAQASHLDDLVAPEAWWARLILASAALVFSAVILIGPKDRRRPVVAPAQAPEPFVMVRSSASRSLDWQAWREGRSTWLLVLAVALFGAWMSGPGGSHGPDSLNALMFASLAALAAGVSVFGPEGAAGTRRFLLHQGVDPGRIWVRKLWIWGLGMAAFGALFFWVPSISTDTRPPFHVIYPDQPALVTGSILLDAFAVGLLAGMAIPRRITAMLVGTIALVATAPAQVGLEQWEMIPPSALLITPLILLGVSRAWAGDWLADRGGVRPLARLGLLLAVPAVLVSAGYIGYRAFGVADFPPAPPVPGPVGQDLTDRYRRIIAEIPAGGPSGEAIDRLKPDATARPRSEGDDPDPARAVLDRDKPVIEKARLAAAEGRGWLALVGDRQVFSGIDTLSALLQLEAGDRQARGDLAGAWEDILALFRLGEQIASGPASVVQSVRASTARQKAADLAFAWANDARQGLPALRKAQADLARLAPPGPAVAALRAESRYMDGLFDLPAAEFGPMLFPARTTILIRAGFNLIVAPTWERRRARMVCRAYLAGQADAASVEPWQRPKDSSPSVAEETVRRGSPLAWRLLVATGNVQDLADRQVEARRALELVLAIRSWQLAHGGQAPANLEELVPGELPRLPSDPYSGRPYGYLWGFGRTLPERHPDGPVRGEDLEATGPRQRLLYSVGPDGIDDWAGSAYLRQTGRGDLIYPIP